MILLVGRYQHSIRIYRLAFNKSSGGLRGDSAADSLLLVKRGAHLPLRATDCVLKARNCILAGPFVST